MHLRFFSILTTLMLLFAFEMAAQDTLQPARKELKSKKLNKTAVELETSLRNNDQAAIARNYEQLAAQFIDKADNGKAEEYLKKALAIYVKTKREEDISRVTRNLAKTQESQNKFGAAAANYKKAGEVADDKSVEKVNNADYNRMINAYEPERQERFVDSKIERLDKEKAKDEVIEAYRQKAEISLKKNDAKAAIESFKNALPFAENTPGKVAEISNEIAKVYTERNQYDKAINITDSVLQKAKAANDLDTQIGQWQALGGIYLEKGEPSKAISSLKKAYDLSFKHGKTAEAKKSLGTLLNYYRSKGDDKNSLALYDEFFRDFDKLIESDSTLIDSKRFQITEEKIRQLEGEKRLKDELISRKNLFNYVLLASIVLLLLFFGFIVRSLYAIRIKNKEIALQSLRREMNPHFIFNSLNSVNQFISQNNELQANKYLSSYSNLMRNMMENSNKDFVTISNEIEQLQKYLELEHMRFRDKFDYKISVDEHLDTETEFIPNMIVQPHLENAIWHGLRYRESKGLLRLHFGLKSGKIAITIDDNGIGLARSHELKTTNQKVHLSRGITNTKERIALLNDLYHKKISLDITEKPAPETGTLVEISFPLIDKT